MKINYPKILKKNMINVLKDVLRKIELNGLNEGHLLYITFQTKNVNNDVPTWLIKKFPEEITIIIQHEYWNLKVLKDKFEIILSFNNYKTNLVIAYNSIISFADPYANFALRLKEMSKKQINKEKKDKKNIKENIIDFSKFKKLH